MVDEAIGWVGAVLILTAFFLSNHGVLAMHDAAYQAMNFFGAAGVVYISWQKSNFQPVFLNIVWCFVALYGLAKIFIT